MLEASQRAKAGVIILGVLAGLALVSLPSIVAPKTVNPSSDGSSLGTLRNPDVLAPAPVSLGQNSGTNPQAVGIGILLIVTPAGAFSLYMRRWAIRRAKAYWPETEN